MYIYIYIHVYDSHSRRLGTALVLHIHAMQTHSTHRTRITRTHLSHHAITQRSFEITSIQTSMLVVANSTRGDLV
jgi:hypothetical protein